MFRVSLTLHHGVHICIQQSLKFCHLHSTVLHTGDDKILTIVIRNCTLSDEGPMRPKTCSSLSVLKVTVIITKCVRLLAYIVTRIIYFNALCNIEQPTALFSCWQLSAAMNITVMTYSSSSYYFSFSSFYSSFSSSYSSSS